MVLLDTHIWIWWLAGMPQLESKYRRALQRLSSPPLLSVISLWEISLLVEHSRVALFPTAKAWLAEATRPDAVRLAQIDRTVAEALLTLPATLSRDPADRIIAATARVWDVPVLTVDRRILRSGAVCAWTV